MGFEASHIMYQICHRQLFPALEGGEGQKMTGSKCLKNDVKGSSLSGVDP